jgi:hypothetical protein
MANPQVAAATAAAMGVLTPDRHERQEACPACWWQMPVRLGRVIQFTTTGQFTTEVNQVC